MVPAASEQPCTHELEQPDMALRVLPHDLHDHGPQSRLLARLEVCGQPLEVCLLLLLQSDELLETLKRVLASSGIGLAGYRGYRHAPSRQVLEGQDRLAQISAEPVSY